MERCFRNPQTYQSHPKVDQLVKPITAIGDLSEGINDPLGEPFYMQAISNGHNGQYFSPVPICDIMATMSVGDDSRPGQTVCDCACGSGRMLLAAAKINRHLCLFIVQIWI
jgi:DNA modification methylase